MSFDFYLSLIYFDSIGKKRTKIYFLRITILPKIKCFYNNQALICLSESLAPLQTPEVLQSTHLIFDLSINCDLSINLIYGGQSSISFTIDWSPCHQICLPLLFHMKCSYYMSCKLLYDSCKLILDREEIYTLLYFNCLLLTPVHRDIRV
jgi:hypothetical protein